MILLLLLTIVVTFRGDNHGQFERNKIPGYEISGEPYHPIRCMLSNAKRRISHLLLSAVHCQVVPYRASLRRNLKRVPAISHAKANYIKSNIFI